MENENQTPHKRRVHYKGKYPKKFEEKYKELQPEKYKDTIAHVIQKGKQEASKTIPPQSHSSFAERYLARPDTFIPKPLHCAMMSWQFR